MVNKKSGSNSDNRSEQAAFKELVSIKIEMAIRYHRFIDFPFFIAKGKEGKTQLSHQMANLAEKLEGYRQKGLKELYLTATDYNQFIKVIRAATENSTPFESGLAEVSELYSQVRTRFMDFGINAYDLMIAEEINQETLRRLEEVPNLSTLVKSYKSRCGDEFFGYLLLSYVMTMLVNSFPWANKQIKIKMGLAALMCDLTLKKEDYAILDQHLPANKLPLSIRNHPIEAARMIYNLDPTISHEVIQLIELHHEEPDGSGFPAGLTEASIPLLPSMFILGRYFADRLRQENYDQEKLESILKETYDRYSSGIFIQINLALFKLFSVEGRVN